MVEALNQIEAEHAALVAVAEAAGEINTICGPNIPKFGGSAGTRLIAALANLAAVRGGGK